MAQVNNMPIVKVVRIVDLPVETMQHLVKAIFYEN